MYIWTSMLWLYVKNLMKIIGKPSYSDQFQLFKVIIKRYKSVGYTMDG